jgi:hypothetical protein
MPFYIRFGVGPLRYSHRLSACSCPPSRMTPR